MNPVDHLKLNPFVLAPMAGITDCAFRTFMRRRGAGVVVTELVSATGLCHSSQKTRDLASFEEIQRPVGIQLFGEDPQNMSAAAKWAQEQGADFVDVNFGCPVPKVVKKGAGSAMLKDLVSMRRLLEAMKNSISVPLTIKIRTGWDAQSRNALEVARLAEDVGVTWVAIHGRTRAQGYSGLADWDYIGDLKAKASIPILGNGDIISPQQAVDRLKIYGLDGVLIGRGCLKNPFIFQQSLDLLHRVESQSGRWTMWDAFSDLRQDLVKHCGERILQIQLKKFAAWYASGYPGAASFRKTVFQLESTDDIVTAAHLFLSQQFVENQVDTAGFLMGGHG